MQESTRSFHMEEYKQLKQEMGGLLARIETLARLGVVVAAAVFSWLAVQGFGPGVTQGSWCIKLPKALFEPAWFLPFSFAVLSALAAFAAYWRGREIATYLRTIESALAASGLGWESFLQPKQPVLTVAASVYWFALLAGTLAVGIGGATIVSTSTAACLAVK